MNVVIHTDENGKVINRIALKEKFDKLKPNSTYSIAFRNTKKRSNSMNSYYWACVVPMVKDALKEVGFDDVQENEDAHLIMKHLFLKKVYKSDKNGDTIEIEGTTTNLDNVQFTEYLEKIWQWASQYLSIVIPAPNQQSEIQY